jgi:hypothetical protein
MASDTKIPQIDPNDPKAEEKARAVCGIIGRDYDKLSLLNELLRLLIGGGCVIGLHSYQQARICAICGRKEEEDG